VPTRPHGTLHGRSRIPKGPGKVEANSLNASASLPQRPEFGILLLPKMRPARKSL